MVRGVRERIVNPLLEIPAACSFTMEGVNDGRPQSTGPEKPAELEAGVTDGTPASSLTVTPFPAEGHIRQLASHRAEVRRA